MIQAWQQIPWQCAGQSPLFLTHGACRWCHVLWGSYAWDPSSWVQRALTKGEEGAGGLGIREAVCTRTCMPMHPTVPRLGGRGLCTCVQAHCSGWDKSGYRRCVFDPVFASLRFGGSSCSLSLSRGIRVLQRPSSYSYSSRSCCQSWRRWQLGPSYSVGRSGICLPKGLGEVGREELGPEILPQC